MYNQYTDASLELNQLGKDSVRKLTQPIKSASFDGKKVVFNNINYIMKHSVKKRMYRVKVKGDYVDITEDHSIMIIRDNIMQSVKPADILKTDKFVKIIKDQKMQHELTSAFEIIDLGIQEVDVYDIEVEDTHNFFGNNILVHNSVYFEVEQIVQKRWSHITDKQQITDLVNEFAENEAAPFIDECYQALSDYLNCDVNLMDMKREAIADTFIIRAKKNYIMRVFDNEGIRFADPYYKMMGIEVVRTSHPQMIRDALEDTLKMVIEGNNDEVRKYVREFKQKFMTSPLNQIAAPRGISDITKYQNDDYTKKEGITIPMHCTAGINYNFLVNKFKLSNKFEFIKNGSKIKFLPLKEPNPIKSHVIGFIDDIPSEFGLDEYIDKEAHFDKMFIKPLETFLIYNGWTIEENTLLSMLGDNNIDMATAAINTKKKTIKKVEKKTTSLF